jgi:hypothetical protein
MAQYCCAQHGPGRNQASSRACGGGKKSGRFMVAKGLEMMGDERRRGDHCFGLLPACIFGAL